MCGIVGIIGAEPVAGQILEALKRLEYRGYDSAGLATLEQGRLTRRRAEGKLRNLEARLSKEPLTGAIGTIDPLPPIRREISPRGLPLPGCVLENA